MPWRVVGTEICGAVCEGHVRPLDKIDTSSLPSAVRTPKVPGWRIYWTRQHNVQLFFWQNCLLQGDDQTIYMSIISNEEAGLNEKSDNRVSAKRPSTCPIDFLVGDYHDYFIGTLPRLFYKRTTKRKRVMPPCSYERASSSYSSIKCKLIVWPFTGRTHT